MHEALAAHHRVVRWDVRGFGASDSRREPYAPADFARDLAALLDVLELDTVHLLGISMGGVIAQRFALDAPERLRSLILVSTSARRPAGVANWQRLAELVEKRGSTPARPTRRAAISPSFAAARPDVMARMTEHPRCEPVLVCRGRPRRCGLSWTAELQRVAIPALILQGLDDQLTPPGGAVKLGRALPRSRVLMIERAGHYLPLEQPDVFRAAFCPSPQAWTAPCKNTVA